MDSAATDACSPLTDGTARWTAHGAFNDPSSPADAARRESIEIRTLYFFD